MIANIEGHFVGATTPKAFACKLAQIPFNNDKSYDIVDSRGEGWSLYAPKMLISPLTMKKRWTKREIIKMFNERENTELAGGKKYSEKSLSVKRLSKVISDLVEISSESVKIEKEIENIGKGTQ